MDDIIFICNIKRWKTGYNSCVQDILEIGHSSTCALIQGLAMSSQVSHVSQTLSMMSMVCTTHAGCSLTHSLNLSACASSRSSPHHLLHWKQYRFLQTSQSLHPKMKSKRRMERAGRQREKLILTAIFSFCGDAVSCSVSSLVDYFKVFQD